jgi:hypothetical protein
VFLGGVISTVCYVSSEEEGMKIVAGKTGRTLSGYLKN